MQQAPTGNSSPESPDAAFEDKSVVTGEHLVDCSADRLATSSESLAIFSSLLGEFACYFACYLFCWLSFAK